MDHRPLLVDTAAFIWWHSDSPRLTRRARRAMLQSLTRSVFVSAVSAFEITNKVRLGKLEVPQALTTDFAYVVEADGFQLLDLDSKSAMHAGLLPSPHRDPFDRLLAAQALAVGALMVSPDDAFAGLGVEVFW